MFACGIIIRFLLLAVGRGEALLFLRGEHLSTRSRNQDLCNNSVRLLEGGKSVKKPLNTREGARTSTWSANKVKERGLGTVEEVVTAGTCANS